LDATGCVFRTATWHWPQQSRVVSAGPLDCPCDRRQQDAPLSLQQDMLASDALKASAVKGCAQRKTISALANRRPQRVVI